MIGAMRVEVLPGHGVAGRWGGYLLVAGADGAPAVLAELVALVEAAAAAGAPSRTLGHRLAGLMTSSRPEDLPSFCALVDDDDAVAVVMRGAAALRAVSAAHEVELAGAERPTWVDDYLRGDFERIEVSAGSGLAPAGYPGDLRAGVVPAGGVVLLAAGVPAAVPAPRSEAAAPEPGAVVGEPEPEPEEAVPEPRAEAPEPPFLTIDLGSPIEEAPRAPLPVAGAASPELPGATIEDDPSVVLVDGVRCARQHFNHPEARYCAQCGIAMVHQTLNLVKGPRPPLGILVFGDGRTLGLDASYVIGRDPTRDPQVQQGAARGFPLEDPDQVLSRVHVELRLSGWDVELVDRGSANGTFLRQSDAEDWRRLDPDDPVRLTSGAEARIGSYNFTFDSHLRPG